MNTQEIALNGLAGLMTDSQLQPKQPKPLSNQAKLANLVIATAARMEAEGAEVTYSSSQSWVKITGGINCNGDATDLFLQGHEATYVINDAEVIYTEAQEVTFAEALAYIIHTQYEEVL